MVELEVRFCDPSRRKGAYEEKVCMAMVKARYGEMTIRGQEKFI